MELEVNVGVVMGFLGAFGVLYGVVTFFREHARKITQAHADLHDPKEGIKAGVEWLVKAHRNADDYGFGTNTINAELREMRKSMARQVALQAMVAEHITDKPLPKWAKDALNGGSDPGTRT
jgi:hypothetical protein